MVFKPILTKREIKKVISELKRQLAQEGFAHSHLMLFGSYAKGRPHPWSDIDICVISKKFGKRDFDDMVRVSKIAKGVNYLIEIHPMNPKDLDQNKHPLSAEIKKTGKRV